MNSNCIFCKIISKEIPADIVYEDSNTLAFLDIFPMKEGHVLVVPKKHVEEFYALDDETYLRVMHVSQKIARVLKRLYAPPKVAQLILGFDVPHTHVHLVPMDGIHDLHADRLKPSKEELQAVADEIKGQL